MRKLKAYIETTLFNFYFDKDREAHSAAVNDLNMIVSMNFEHIERKCCC
jgi:hypothetical protein